MAAFWNWIYRWFASQWADVRGNLKYALAYWIVLGGGMTWLAHHLQATLHANLAGWLSLAAPIFSILAVAYLVAISAGRNSARIPARIPAPPPTPNASSAIQRLAALPELPVRPKPVDLQGKFLELYIQSFEDLLHITKTYVAMKVQIVNHGPDEATIVSCGLHISLGPWSMEGQIMNRIPDDWRINKKRENSFLVASYDEVPLEPLLRASEVYKKGHPVSGWLAFELYVFGDVEFPNAQFNLNVTDSFDVTHAITRKAGVYPQTGELIRVDPKPSPHAGL